MKIFDGYKRSLGLSNEEKLSKQIGSAISWIWQYLKKYKIGLAICFTLSIAMTLVSLATSVLSKYVIDAVIVKNIKVFLLAAIASVVLYVVSTLVGIYVNRKMFDINVSSTNDIRKDVFRKIFDVSWENLLSFRPGDLINRAKGDTGTLSEGFISNIFSFIRNAVILVGSFIIIIRYDWVFAVIAAVGAPVLALTYRALSKKMRDLSRKTKISESEVMAFSAETMYNLQTIKSFSVAGLKIIQLVTVLNKNKKIKTEQNDYSIFVNTLIGVLGIIASYSCVAWAIFRLWNGRISYGTMTMFIQLASFAMSSMKGLISFFPALINTATSVSRIREVTELEPEDADAEEKATALSKRIRDKISSIELDNVNVSYRTKKNVLTDVNIKIGSNDTVAIIGPSGGGKTTLFRVLLGLIKPENGSAIITTDDDERLNISPYTRKLFAYVPQGNTVFSGTVADNIRIVNQNISDEQITDVLKLACAYDFVSELPDGINTEIGENGYGLSEGQAQRIAIARAIACDAPIILFDEATSALDTRTERTVLKNISELGGNRICIFSTHRFSVLDVCDTIYRVNGHRIDNLTFEEAKDYCLNI